MVDVRSRHGKVDTSVQTAPVLAVEQGVQMLAYRLAAGAEQKHLEVLCLANQVQVVSELSDHRNPTDLSPGQ